MSFVEALAHKRDGARLTADQIRHFIHGATHGTVPVEQLAAMLMAICCRGMDAEETRALTHEMLVSGEQWNLAEQHPDAVDKHSTGGVGDTVSLVVAPLLAAVGVRVAMMAGRGLGHTQGTLDKLAAIPGFRCDYDRTGMLQLLDACGVALIAQTTGIAPADRVLYALRDVTGTVPSLPLIISSIMSKKLALGAGSLVLDVKWGSGAFCQSLDQALELASGLRGVAREMGVVCEALITDMNQPLGSALGTANEVRAAVTALSADGEKRLAKLSCRLAEEAMVLRGLEREPSRHKLEKALASGAALACWERVVRAHGGDPDPHRLPQPRTERVVVSPSSGYVGQMHAQELGWVAVALGAGRRRVDEEIDVAAGLLVHTRLGQWVEQGQPVATVQLGGRAVDEDAIAARVARAIVVHEQPPAAAPLVAGTPDEVVKQLREKEKE